MKKDKTVQVFFCEFYEILRTSVLAEHLWTAASVLLKLYFSWQIFHVSTKVRTTQINVSWKFTKLTGKHLYQGLFFNKVASLRPGTLLQKRLWHRCFPVNFTYFRKKSFYFISDIFDKYFNEWNYKLMQKENRQSKI